MESGPSLVAPAVAARPRLTLVRDDAPVTPDHLARRAGGGEDAAVRTVAAKTCSCGHARQAHEHYRRGSDCALCDCARYSRPILTRLLGR